MMWNVEVVQILVLFDAVMEPDSAKGWLLPCPGETCCLVPLTLDTLASFRCPSKPLPVPETENQDNDF